MLKFLKAVSAVIVGNLVSAGVLFALMFVACFLFVWIAASSIQNAVAVAPKTSIGKNTVLVLDLNTNITDTPDARGAGEFLREAISGEQGESIGLLDLTRGIDGARDDKKIIGMLIVGSLQPENFGSGYAALAEVREAVVRFRAAGKFVTAYLESPALRDYHLATAADKIIINPFADMPLFGLASSNAYYGGMLKKYGVGVQTTKVGSYKSAVEPFISDHMSDADRRQRGELLDSVWRDLAADIAHARRLKPDALAAAANKAPIISADDAVAAGFVDKTGYLDEVIDGLRASGANDRSTGSFAQVNLTDYLRLSPPPDPVASGRRIAVVYAEGEIVDGVIRAPGSFGGARLAEEIRLLREDSEVEALVLRVNSPGGSAYASEIARRELDLFKKTGRPVIVSMGSLAASGGYWIAAGADRIFAEKTTITGSIGVFGLMFNIGEAAGNFGVKFDGVKTALFADMATITRPKTKEELEVIQKSTDEIYAKFIGIVADGRKMKRKDVEAVAEGRVWSGESARALGLVDEIGGLADAINLARRATGLPSDSGIEEIPRRRVVSEMFAEIFSGDKNRRPVMRSDDPVSKITALLRRQLRTLSCFNDRRGVYARMPECAQID